MWDKVYGREKQAYHIYIIDVYIETPQALWGAYTLKVGHTGYCILILGRSCIGHQTPLPCIKVWLAHTLLGQLIKMILIMDKG